jgi:hypothetical protein
MSSHSKHLQEHTSAYISIRQHTSAYVSIRPHTSAYVSIRQHTSAYVRIRHVISLKNITGGFKAPRREAVLTTEAVLLPNLNETPHDATQEDDGVGGSWGGGGGAGRWGGGEGGEGEETSDEQQVAY